MIPIELVSGLRIFLALGTAGTLVGLSVLHVIWTLSPWPLADWGTFRRTVLGRADIAGAVSPARAPSPPGVAATWAVAALLAFTAWIALASMRLAPWPMPEWMLFWGARIAGGVLMCRGVAGLALALAAPLATTPEFTRWSGRLYSPLALLLGLSLLLNHAA